MHSKSALIFLLMTCGCLQAQRFMRKAKMDSLTVALRADSAHIYRKTFAKPFLKIENQNSFISNEQVNLIGGMVGATFVERHTAAIGYYFLDTRKKKPIALINNRVTTNNYIDLFYYLAGYQYVVFNKRFVQMNLPLAIGYGRYDVNVTDTLDRTISTEKGYIWPFNGGLQLILKPIRWAGLSATGGYRYVAQQQNIDLSLKGWYYSFGLWIDARQILRNFRYYRRKQAYRAEIHKYD